MGSPFLTDMSKWMLRNSSGERDGSFTFATISFIVVTFCVLLSCVEVIYLGEVKIVTKSADATLALGYLAACFSTYVVRRTQKETNTPSSGQENKE